MPPAGLPGLAVSLSLTGSGSGRLRFGPFSCSGHRTCIAAASIPAARCGGQDCTATATCVLTDSAHGSCAVVVRPCGDRSTCAVGGPLLCSGADCTLVLQLAIVAAASPPIAGSVAGLVAGILLVLLVAILWLRRPATRAVAVQGPAPPPVVEAAAPGVAAVAEAEGKIVHVGIVAQRVPPFDCRAALAGRTWVLPGLIFLPTIEINAQGFGGGAGVLEGWMTVTEVKAEIAEKSATDLVYGMSDAEWAALDRTLKAEVLGPDRVGFSCRRGEFAFPRFDVEVSVSFSRVLEMLLQREQGEHGVTVMLQITAEAFLGGSREAASSSLAAHLYLDRDSGRVMALDR